jgi:hypothetical protein
VVDVGNIVAADAEVRGIVLAVSTLGGGASAFAALDGQAGAACAEAGRALARLELADRQRVLGVWRAEAASVIPSALSRLHPSWCEAALAGERRDIVAAIAAGGEAARVLARIGFGPLFPLCESRPGPVGEALCGVSFDALVAALTRRGARLAGRSLASASPRLRARAMAAAGEPWAAELAAGAAEPSTVEEQAAAAALVAEAGPWPTARERLLQVGLTAAKRELEAEGQASLLSVAGRLPAPLGRGLTGW